MQPKGNQLAVDRIRELRQTTCPIAIQLRSTVDSTNAWAKRVPAASDSPMQAFLAEQQTAGYGKRQRAFFSPAFQGVYLTVRTAVTAPVNPGRLTTAVGVMVVRCLAATYPKQTFQLKWVNDILLHQRKCGGILVENLLDRQEVLIGIGVNVTTRFSTELTNKATSIVQGNRGDRNVLVAGLLDELVMGLPHYQDAQFLADYQQLCTTLGQAVRVQVGPDWVQGVAVTLTDQGALVIQLASGERRIVASSEAIKVMTPVGDYRG